jgi:hypothetical protein
LGDFGLVQTPDPAGLTQPGRKLGPQNFLPYEAQVEAENAEGGPIDVYELAKTLWVLVCDLPWAPLGHQALDAGYPIEGYRLRAHARELDRIVDRCTRQVPRERPPMSQVAADFRAWIVLAQREPEQEALASAAAAVRRRLGPAMLVGVQRDREQGLGREVLQRLQEVFSDLKQWLEQELPGLVSEGYYERDVIDRLRGPSADQLAGNHVFGAAATLMLQGSTSFGAPVVLRVGRWAELFDDGTLVVRVGLQLDVAGNDQDEFEVILDRRVPVDSTQAEGVPQETRKAIAAHLPGWVERFATAVV